MTGSIRGNNGNNGDGSIYFHKLNRTVPIILSVAVLIAVVVSVDLLFFKNRFWERLMVNIGIVLVFAAFYLRFLKNP